MGYYRIRLSNLVTVGADVVKIGKESLTDCTTAPAEYLADCHEGRLFRSRERLLLPWPVIIDQARLMPVVTEAVFIKIAPAETTATIIHNSPSIRDREFTDIAHLGLLSG